MRFVGGSVFDTPKNFAIVVPVNAVGVPGAGLAKAAAAASPAWAKAYKRACVQGILSSAGDVALHTLHPLEERRRQWVSFATKTHWRQNSDLQAIDNGLRLLVWLLKLDKGWKGVPLAVPALGCGLGGLKWEEVRPLLLEHLSGLDDREVIVFS